MTEAEESSFDELQKEIVSALVQTTKSAGILANEDLNFLRTSNQNIAKPLDKSQSRLLTTIRRLIRCAVKDTELTAPELNKAEDVGDNWSGIVDIIDNLLEKADRCLDEYSGTVTKTAAPEPSDTGSVKQRITPRAENIAKPQRSFANPPQNESQTSFYPLLKTKPHAIVSLEESIAPEENGIDGTEKIVPPNGLQPASPPGFRHPYAHEIKTYQYPPRVYETCEPIPPQPYENTTAVWVDTLEGVQEMLSELKKAKEIAIDLEHHDIRTFTGIVCLMQISTREKDWIVDTLKPWREELQILNEVFADPDIVKVLHGAQMDIIWLQRDLGLYLVGLFDTYFAARSLGYVKHSLAFLLHKFVNFDAQKQYQLADWRTRPLPSEMFNYARSDTHFLLYIYDNMKNELIAKANGGAAIIGDVLDQSKRTALQRYERSNYDPELGLGDRGWYGMLARTPAVFNKEQFSVFKAVHQWRDQLARKEDESPPYLMSTTTLFNIARDMPMTLPNLQSHLNRKIDVLSRRVSELLKVIQDAKARGANGPEMNDFMANHPVNLENLERRAVRKEAAANANMAEQQFKSVAEIAKEELLTISGDNLKTSRSLFWGSAMYDHERTELGRNSTLPQFQIPLPNLTAEVFAVEGEIVEESTKDRPLPEHRYTKPSRNEAIDDEDDVFILKETGGSRKRKPKHQDIRSNDSPRGNGMEMQEADSIALDDTDPSDRQRRRAERKRARKERRAAEKMGVAEAEDRGMIAQSKEDEVFDYDNAPSVLHAKQEAAGGNKGKHRAPVINPYAKSMDAPKGLPKKKKDIQGKSATFKT